MKVFLYEFTCDPANQGRAECAALQAEGAAMLAALCDDFGRIPRLEILILPADPLSSGPTFSYPAEAEKAFRDRARAADFSLVVAPECGGILLARCGWVEEVQGRLLGPSLAALRLAGDKLALARHWQACGLATPEVVSWRPGAATPPVPFPAVLKPRDGAGSQATFLVRQGTELPACCQQARAEGWHGEWLVQALVQGQAASVAFLTGPLRNVALLPAAQHVSADGRFHYQGGSLPLPPRLGERALRLARRAVETVAGLRGYIGVDLVLGDAEDGSEDWLIEINPRLTTSYVGLRALAKTNLAEVLLQVATGQPVEPVSWQPGVVDFQADGTVQRR